jgi:PAS domain S-box-containing protein
MSSQALPAPATELFRYLFVHASLGIAVEDLNGKILLANPAFCSMLGYTEKELCSMSCSQFANPEDSEDDWAHFQQLREGIIDHYSLEKRYVRKDGAQIWGRLNVSLSKNGGTASPLVFALVEEITARKLADEELVRTNERLRLSQEAGKSVGWEWDVKTGRDSWFGDLQTMFGIPSKTFEGRTEDFYRYVHVDDRQKVARAVAEARETRKPYAAEFRVIRHDGSVRWVNARGNFYYDAKGDAIRMLGMATDVTERKQVEDELKRSEVNCRLFFSQASEGIFCQELDRPIPVDLPEDEQIKRILHESYMAECNDSLAKMYGVATEDFIGKRLSETLEVNNPTNVALTREYIQGGYRVVDRESHEVDAQGNSKVFLNSMIGHVENGMLLRTWGIQRDVTDRRRAEEDRLRVEQALRQSEERFRLAAQIGKMYAYEWDAKTDRIVRSGAQASMLGLKDEAQQLTRQELLSTIHLDDRPIFISSLEQLTPENPRSQLTYRVLRPDASVVWLEKTQQAFFDDQRKISRVIGVVTDVSQRKLAEEALRQKDEALMEAQRLAGVGSWQWDSAADSVVWSKEMYRLMGIDPHLPAPSFKEHEQLFTPESWERLRHAVEAALQTGTPYKLDLEGVNPKSAVKWEIARGEPLRDGSGRIIGLRGTVQDITELRRSEEALRESEQRFRLVANTAPVMIWMAGIDKLCNYFNQPWLEFTGRPLEAELGNGWAQLVHPDDLNRCLDTYTQAFDRRESFDMEYRLRRRDGEYRWVTDIGVPRFNPDQTFAGYIGSCIDVTDRKRAEEGLKKSEEKFSKAFRESPMALTLTSARDHRYIDVNETFERITGWRREEILGRTSFDIGLLNEAERIEITTRLVAEQSLRNLELGFRMRDGSIRIGLSSAELIELEGEPCVLAVTADITDRKRTQEALRESEDKLRLLLDSTAEAIYGLDLEHRCTFCNPACLRTLGYASIDEVLGKNMHDLMHHSRANGTLIPLEECRVHRVIQSGEGVHAEDEVFWKADKTSFPAEYWSYPQRRGGELIGSVVTFIDITERKAAELALASVSRKLIEAQEQERTRIARELHDDIGQRLGMLAIEIDELRQNSSELPIAGRVAELWKHTCEIATDVQSLSHELHSAKLEYLGVLAAMRAFCKDFGEQQKMQVSFRAHDVPNPVPTEVSVCLFRVLQEALHNAAKYSGVKQSEVRLWGTPDELHLTISDSGEGFDRETANVSGGLGLISMEERLKLVSGTLSIESQPKRGTVIHAQVPLKSDAPLMRAAG